MASQKLKLLAASGIIAPLIYITTLILGNVLDPTYSQIGKTVSELIQTGAPNRELLNGLFVTYNLLLIPFAVGLYLAMKRGWAQKTVTASIIAIAVLGVFWTLLFPLDANGAAVSQTGMLHLVVGGLVVPLTFAFQLAFWRGTKADRRWGRLGTFSLIMFAVTLVSGLTTVAFVNSDLRGLFERLSIGSTLLWFEVVAIGLFILPKQPVDNSDLNVAGSRPK